MDFEYDPAKSKSNQEKHGINFEEAQRLWEDSGLLVFPAKEEQESRYLVIGKIADKYWTSICTYRGEKIRIISVRRSRKEEVVLYENYEN